MADNTPNPQRDELEQFRTRDRSEVESNLRELGRNREPLTVLFDSGKQSLPTSIIDVIANNSKVIFERSGNEEMNAKLLLTKKGTVVGNPGGIKTRFLLEPIETIKHEGETVFVAPLPREHYRMQRRQRFRMDTQLGNPVKVTLTMPDDAQLTLSAGNISSGGLRLDDLDHQLDCQTRQLFSACNVQIPDLEPFEADLEVRYTYEREKKQGSPLRYVGCRFVDLRADHERDIQSYINALQLALRALEV